MLELSSNDRDYDGNDNDSDSDDDDDDEIIPETINIDDGTDDDNISETINIELEERQSNPRDDVDSNDDVSVQVIDNPSNETFC